MPSPHVSATLLNPLKHAVPGVPKKRTKLRLCDILYIHGCKIKPINDRLELCFILETHIRRGIRQEVPKTNLSREALHSETFRKLAQKPPFLSNSIEELEQKLVDDTKRRQRMRNIRGNSNGDNDIHCKTEGHNVSEQRVKVDHSVTSHSDCNQSAPRTPSQQIPDDELMAKHTKITQKLDYDRTLYPRTHTAFRTTSIRPKVRVSKPSERVHESVKKLESAPIICDVGMRYEQSIDSVRSKIEFVKSKMNAVTPNVRKRRKKRSASPSRRSLRLQNIEPLSDSERGSSLTSVVPRKPPKPQPQRHRTPSRSESVGSDRETSTVSVVSTVETRSSKKKRTRDISFALTRPPSFKPPTVIQHPPSPPIPRPVRVPQSLTKSQHRNSTADIRGESVSKMSASDGSGSSKRTRKRKRSTFHSETRNDDGSSDGGESSSGSESSSERDSDIEVLNSNNSNQSSKRMKRRRSVSSSSTSCSSPNMERMERATKRRRYNNETGTFIEGMRAQPLPSRSPRPHSASEYGDSVNSYESWNGTMDTRNTATGHNGHNIESDREMRESREQRIARQQAEQCAAVKREHAKVIEDHNRRLEAFEHEMDSNRVLLRHGGENWYSWTCFQVVQFVQSMGIGPVEDMAMFEKNVVENNICGQDLHGLSDVCLRMLGIKDATERKRVLTNIESLLYRTNSSSL